jgi:hypothetical protein
MARAAVATIVDVINADPADAAEFFVVQGITAEYIKNASHYSPADRKACRDVFDATRPIRAVIERAYPKEDGTEFKQMAAYFELATTDDIATLAIVSARDELPWIIYPTANEQDADVCAAINVSACGRGTPWICPRKAHTVSFNKKDAYWYMRDMRDRRFKRFDDMMNIAYTPDGLDIGDLSPEEVVNAMEALYTLRVAWEEEKEYVVDNAARWILTIGRGAYVLKAGREFAQGGAAANVVQSLHILTNNGCPMVMQRAPNGKLSTTCIKDGAVSIDAADDMTGAPPPAVEPVKPAARSVWADLAEQQKQAEMNKPDAFVEFVRARSAEKHKQAEVDNAGWAAVVDKLAVAAFNERVKAEEQKQARLDSAKKSGADKLAAATAIELAKAHAAEQEKQAEAARAKKAVERKEQEARESVVGYKDGVFAADLAAHPRFVPFVHTPVEGAFALVRTDVNKCPLAWILWKDDAGRGRMTYQMHLLGNGRRRTATVAVAPPAEGAPRVRVRNHRDVYIGDDHSFANVLRTILDPLQNGGAVYDASVVKDDVDENDQYIQERILRTGTWQGQYTFQDGLDLVGMSEQCRTFAQDAAVWKGILDCGFYDVHMVQRAPADIAYKWAGPYVHFSIEDSRKRGAPTILLLFQDERGLRVADFSIVDGRLRWDNYLAPVALYTNFDVVIAELKVSPGKNAARWEDAWRCTADLDVDVAPPRSQFDTDFDAHPRFVPFVTMCVHAAFAFVRAEINDRPISWFLWKDAHGKGRVTVQRRMFAMRPRIETFALAASRHATLADAIENVLIRASESKDSDCIFTKDARKDALVVAYILHVGNGGRYTNDDIAKATATATADAINVFIDGARMWNDILYYGFYSSGARYATPNAGWAQPHVQFSMIDSQKVGHPRFYIEGCGLPTEDAHLDMDVHHWNAYSTKQGERDFILYVSDLLQELQLRFSKNVQGKDDDWITHEKMDEVTTVDEEGEEEEGEQKYRDDDGDNVAPTPTPTLDAFDSDPRFVSFVHTCVEASFAMVRSDINGSCIGWILWRDVYGRPRMTVRPTTFSQADSMGLPYRRTDTMVVAMSSEEAWADVRADLCALLREQNVYNGAEMDYDVASCLLNTKSPCIASYPGQIDAATLKANFAEKVPATRANVELFLSGAHLWEQALAMGFYDAPRPAARIANLRFRMGRSMTTGQPCFHTNKYHLYIAHRPQAQAACWTCDGQIVTDDLSSIFDELSIPRARESGEGDNWLSLGNLEFTQDDAYGGLLAHPHFASFVTTETQASFAFACAFVAKKSLPWILWGSGGHVYLSFPTGNNHTVREVGPVVSVLINSVAEIGLTLREYQESDDASVRLVVPFALEQADVDVDAVLLADRTRESFLADARLWKEVLDVGYVCDATEERIELSSYLQFNATASQKNGTPYFYIVQPLRRSSVFIRDGKWHILNGGQYDALANVLDRFVWDASVNASANGRLVVNKSRVD